MHRLELRSVCNKAWDTLVYVEHALVGVALEELESAKSSDECFHVRKHRAKGIKYSVQSIQVPSFYSCFERE